MGPAAAALIEFIKVLLHMLKGSSTAGVGDFANFLIGCSMAMPAAFIYRRHKTKNTAIIGMIAGTVSMTVIGGFLNAYVLLPAYSAALVPMETILEMGKAVNSSIDSVASFVIIAVTPFNLVKGIVVSLMTMLLYKHISKILKNL